MLLLVMLVIVWLIRVTWLKPKLKEKRSFWEIISTISKLVKQTVNQQTPSIVLESPVDTRNTHSDARLPEIRGVVGSEGEGTTLKSCEK